MKAFIFPGQGSQIKGMGRELFDTVPEFTAWEPDLDKQLGYSLRDLCLTDADRSLSQTQYTQPCLYIVNALHYLKLIQDSDETPTIFAGHSLGEYNALWAAGAFDIFTGLRLVRKRGELMSQAKDGSMAAVIGLTAERISELLAENALDALSIANKNAPQQTVLSGAIDQLEQAKPIMQEAGASAFIKLPVSAAFHSQCMVAARTEYDEFLNSIEFDTPQTPVIANVTARPYPSGKPNEVIRTFLSQQITRSVEWVATVRYLLNKGVSDFQECGPGTVLTKLVGNIRNDQVLTASGGQAIR